MKTIYLSLVGLLLLLTSFASAAPIAHWTFDECNGTTAADVTGNGNTGTLQNGVNWTIEGRFGCAIDLDGTDDFVFVADAPPLDITQNITISAWIYPRSYGTGGPWYGGQILTKWGADQRSYAFHLDDSGRVYFRVSPDGQEHGIPGPGTVVSNTQVPLNQWTHISGVYDGSFVKVYVNGRLDNVASYIQGIFSGTNPLAIGSLVNGNQAWFNGKIDEVEVRSDAQGPQIVFLNVTNIGGTSVSPLFKRPNNPFEVQFAFQPNALYFNATTLPPETIVGTLTLTVPFLVSQPYYLRYYIELREFNTPLNYAFENFGFMPRMLFATLHFDEVTSFYLTANRATEATVPIAKAFLDLPYYIQALAYNGNEFVLSDGYRVVVPKAGPLPPSSLPQEYTPDNFTVGLWHVDEGTGTTVYDETTNGNNGILQNGASFAQPAPIERSDHAIAFDGIDDYILVPDGDSLDLTNAFTLEAWIRLNGLQRYPITGKWNDNNVTDRHWAYLMEFNNNKLRLTIGQNQQWDYLFGETLLGVGRWYHVAATFDNGRMRVYVNGRLDGEKNSTITGVSILDEPLRIGYAYMNGFEHLYFDGVIDEVRISNKARSPSEFNVP